jgi:hypothetical protein
MNNYLNFQSKKDKQKVKRSANDNQIFINTQTGKTYFIQQLNEYTFSINGTEYQKKKSVPTITITKKIKKQNSTKIMSEIKQGIDYLNKKLYK